MVENYKNRFNISDYLSKKVISPHVFLFPKSWLQPSVNLPAGFPSTIHQRLKAREVKIRQFEGVI